MLAKADSPLSRCGARGASAAPSAQAPGLSIQSARNRRLRRLRVWAERRSPGCLSHEDGIALIEVMISALLVAVISIAVLNGFDLVGHTTSEQRFRNEAAVIASESQEALRSDPVSTLDVLASDSEAEKPHTYKRTVGGETFTVVEEARHVTGASGTAGCNATTFKEGSQPTGQYVRVSSVVTWPQLQTRLEAQQRGLGEEVEHPVRQASTITPPDGSTLEVDVTDQNEAPLEGVTVEADGIRTVTGSAGCVVYSAIPATTVGLKAFKQGYVTRTGQTEVVAGEVQIAPNITTHYPIRLAQGGAIEAHYAYKGETLPGGSAVEGEAFVAAQNEIAPEFMLGGATGSPSPTATLSNVFPSTSPWTVYAGDCPEDDPQAVGTELPATVTVLPGQTATVDVPTSHVSLSVMEGSEPGKPGNPASTIYPVKLEDAKCNQAVPANATSAAYQHTQSTTSSGHLSYPYQPFGYWTLCLYDAATKQTYSVAYENKAAEGASPTIYLGATGTEAGVEREKVLVRSNQATNTC